MTILVLDPSVVVVVRVVGDNEEANTSSANSVC